MTTPNRFVWQPGDITIKRASKKVQLSRYGLRTEPVRGADPLPPSVDPQFIALYNHTHDDKGRFGVGDTPKPAGGGEDLAAKHAIRISAAYKAKDAEITAKYNGAMAKGLDTQSQFDHVDGHIGAYTKVQTVRQDAILKPLVNDPNLAHDRQAIVMGGLPGSGKSLWLSNPENVKMLGIDPKTALGINSDDLKTAMIKTGMAAPSNQNDYLAQGLKSNEATGLIHEESADMANRLNLEAQARGTNVLIDVTLNSEKQFNSKITDMEAQTGIDYRTTLVFVDTNKETPMDRAAARYWKDGAQTGRYIPIALTDNAKSSPSGNTMNLESYLALKNSPNVDRAILVNADGTIREDTGWKTK